MPKKNIKCWTLDRIAVSKGGKGGKYTHCITPKKVKKVKAKTKPKPKSILDRPRLSPEQFGKLSYENQAEYIKRKRDRENLFNKKFLSYHLKKHR